MDGRRWNRWFHRPWIDKGHSVEQNANDFWSAIVDIISQVPALSVLAYLVWQMQKMNAATIELLSKSVRAQEAFTRIARRQLEQAGDDDSGDYLDG